MPNLPKVKIAYWHNYHFMKKLCYTCIILLLFTSTARSNTFDINLCSSHNVSDSADSTLLIATNRVFSPGSQGFLGNTIDPHDSLRYFIAIARNNEWNVFRVKSLAEGLGFLPTNRNLVFFVHGDGKSFARLVNLSASISTHYKVNVISFDYPSYLPRTGSIRNFYNSRKNARESITCLDQFLSEAQTTLFQSNSPFKTSSKTVFCHSLGVYLFREYINNCKDTKSDTIRWIDNLLLNSGAVKMRGHRKWVEKISSAKRIYITSNKKDYTLQGAMLITFSKQLGGNIKKPLANNALYINFTQTAGKNHADFLIPDLLNGPHLFREFYFETLSGKVIDLHKLTIPRKDGKGYNLR